MNQIAHETGSANLEHEMRRSYLDYAMSVIVGRALPDVRDGLKPVHRRVLYAMFQLGNEWNKPYKKSARITGDVIGKYHPHSDAAVYDTIVRMAQNFSMRYPLVEGQGNFGSVDGDPPAAMRYTEIRLQRIAHEMLADIDRETVDFGPNYDDTEVQPLVLPGRMPNLLVNGSSGIAVGMATNIPTHNLDEVVNACLAYMDNEDIGVEELMRHIPGPDFPTAGIINGSQGIYDAYRTGRGKIYVRGRVTLEETKSGRQAIIISELPYQVNKKLLVEKISELVREKRITGIAAMRDESDRDGMRIYIEVKRGEVADVVVNNLYRATRLETVFGINMVALVDNQPRLFTLKEIIAEFIRHRREVVTRATVFDLRKARERAHVLEGQAVALSNIDQVVAVIKATANPAAARAALVKRAWPPGVVLPMLKRAAAQQDKGEGEGGGGEGDGAAPQLGLVKSGYLLSEIQAQAILDLRLHRLTGLEQEKIHREYDEVLTKIADLRDILDRQQRLNEVVRGDLEDVRQRYADKRRTEIVASRSDLSTEDLIAEEDVVVTLSHAGYAKSQPVADYRTQRRGGKGRTATRTREEDFVARMFTANSHDTILCFSDRGKVYWLRVFQLPQAGRQARGKPLVNLLSLQAGEKVTEILPIKGYDAGKYVVMATANGTVAKCALEKFSRPRPSGLKAITFREDDHLVGAALTEDGDDLLLFSDNGKAMRFCETGVRTTARGAIGVRGIKLDPGCRVISLLVAPDGDASGEVLASTENGYGKRTPLADFPRKGRGGKGVIAIKTSARNGKVVGAVMVTGQEEAMLITDGGTLIRTRTHEISLTGRNTQGVRLIKPGKGERLIGMIKVEEAQLGNGDGGDGESGDSDGESGDSGVENGDSDVGNGDSDVENGGAGR